jgi:hypothetical protein
MFEFSAVYPYPILWAHIHKQKHNNRKRRKRSFIFSNQHPKTNKKKEEEEEEKKIKHTECTKEKVFDFLCFLDSVSYHIVHMIWWKREEKKKTIWNNNAHTHTH